MTLKFIPTFRLLPDGENKPIAKELGDKLSHTYLSVIIIADRVQFRVMRRESMMDHVVLAIADESSWSFRTSKNDLFLDNVLLHGGERSLSVDSSVGKFIAGTVRGVASGNVSGDSACSALFDLLLFLEVENPADDPWLEKHFPTFFRYYRDKIKKDKENRVKDVMES